MDEICLGDDNPFDDLEFVQKLGKDYKKIFCEGNYPLDQLPDGITHLTICNLDFNHPLNNLPPSLKYLCIRGLKLDWEEAAFNQPLDFLPPNLKCLILDALECFNHPLDNLPPNLEYLYLNINNYDLELSNLPPNLKKFYKLSWNHVFNDYNPIPNYPEI